VFAALGGLVILGESLSARGAVGCAVMFAGMLASQAPLVLSAHALVLHRGGRRV